MSKPMHPLSGLKVVELARILAGPYSTWRAALTSKVRDLPAQERDEWIKSLSEAKITVERQRS